MICAGGAVIVAIPSVHIVFALTLMYYLFFVQEAFFNEMSNNDLDDLRLAEFYTGDLIGIHLAGQGPKPFQVAGLLIFHAALRIEQHQEVIGEICHQEDPENHFHKNNHRASTPHPRIGGTPKSMLIIVL